MVIMLLLSKNCNISSPLWVGTLTLNFHLQVPQHVIENMSINSLAFGVNSWCTTPQMSTDEHAFLLRCPALTSLCISVKFCCYWSTSTKQNTPHSSLLLFKACWIIWKVFQIQFSQVSNLVLGLCCSLQSILKLQTLHVVTKAPDDATQHAN